MRPWKVWSVFGATNKCLIIKNTLQIKRIKEVLGWTYFGSIDFLAVDSIKDFPAYSDNQCFFILYLSRNNLKLNLFNDELVAKFVNDCQDWIGQTYSKMRESIESFSFKKSLLTFIFYFTKKILWTPYLDKIGC